MNYAKTPLLKGELVKRYKRFLADVLIDGELLTVHCPNSGSMAGLADAGNPVLISGPYGLHRKLPYTLEQIQITRPDDQTVWVGVNTAIPNKIVAEAARNRLIPWLKEYSHVRTEVKLGEHSRIDLLLEGDNLPPCWIEVKNTTLVQGNPATKNTINEGIIGTFPDAVTARGKKHLDALMERVASGDRAMMIYTVQRSDAKAFSISSGFDPAYAKRFLEAKKAGVEILPLPVTLTPESVTLGETPLPILIGKK